MKKINDILIYHHYIVKNQISSSLIFLVFGMVWVDSIVHPHPLNKTKQKVRKIKRRGLYWWFVRFERLKVFDLKKNKIKNRSLLFLEINTWEMNGVPHLGHFLILILPTKHKLWLYCWFNNCRDVNIFYRPG